jgi:hypothetical protein
MSAAEPRSTYAASRTKRPRATNAEMKERADFFVAYAERHDPVTVRQLYYQAEVAGLPGIEKTDAGYNKVQRQVLKLRRKGLLKYRHIADATRWTRHTTRFDTPEEAIRATAKFYRKSLWTAVNEYVEIWCEKDALAGVIFGTADEYDTPLMVTRGFVSEEKLERFAADKGIRVDLRQIAVTEQQIRDWKLPTRPPKRNSPADRKWPHTFACELDAIDPDTLRYLVEAAILRHLNPGELKVLRAAEESEREILLGYARRAA